jgi:hypothetical protein
MNEANRNRNDRRVPPNANDPPNSVNRYQPTAHQQRWNRRTTSDTSRQSLHPQRPRLQPLIVASNTNNDNPTISPPSRQLPLQPPQPMLTSDPDPCRPAIVTHPSRTWTAPRDHGTSTLGVAPQHQQQQQPQPQTSVGSTVQQQQQLPPSGTTNLPQSPPTSQLRTYLTTLSESCRKHQLTAHSTATTTTQPEEEEGTSPNHFCYPLSSAPTYCQDAIQTLIRILPHIEDCMQQTIQEQQQRRRQQQQRSLHQVDRVTTTSMVHPITARNNNDNGNNVDNDDDMDNILLMMSHMCDFYTDVMRGGFCPQAPHLFLHSVQGKFT